MQNNGGLREPPPLGAGTGEVCKYEVHMHTSLIGTLYQGMPQSVSTLASMRFSVAPRADPRLGILVQNTAAAGTVGPLCAAASSSYSTQNTGHSAHCCVQHNNTQQSARKARDKTMAGEFSRIPTELYSKEASLNECLPDYFTRSVSVGD